MMNRTIFSIATLAVALIALPACGDEDPVLTHRDWEGTDTYYASTDAQKQDIYYKPYVGYVGDPMPFYDPVAGDFKIMYLQDFRPNPVATYHPIWAVSTADAASYTSLGELIPCGAATEIDAALGTGSTIYHEGVYYTFYTAHSADASVTGFGEAVMLATSTDFKTWTKDRSLLITGGDTYSRTDFRDPFVFEGEDGKFHMLVSTTSNGKGVLAEFVSSDLRSWSSAGVFMTMVWDRFYECPDLFKMGDWWYLVYSEMHSAIRRVQYFKGRTLDELRACTADEGAVVWPDSHEGFLNSRGFYAGKTASDGTDRYMWGWCPTRSGNNNLNVGAAPSEPEWAGNLVAHKLVQHPDGSLSLGEVPAIAGLFAQAETIPDFTLPGDSYSLMSRLGAENRISFTVTTRSATDRFGISLVRGSDSKRYYSIVFNPENESTRKINFEEEGEEGIGFVAGIDGYPFPTPSDGVYRITVVTDNSVVSVYVNDEVAYTNRIYGIARNCWSINSYGGEIAITGLKVSKK